jgi:hypothetical protein
MVTDPANIWIQWEVKPFSYLLLTMAVGTSTFILRPRVSSVRKPGLEYADVDDRQFTKSFIGCRIGDGLPPE